MSKKSKINFWQILGLIGTISEEVNEALADDQKIDVTEIIKIGIAVANRLKFPLESDAQKTVDLILTILEELPEIVKDGKVTVNEIIQLGKTVCEHLEIELDEDGFELPDHI